MWQLKVISNRISHEKQNLYADKAFSFMRQNQEIKLQGFGMLSIFGQLHIEEVDWYKWFLLWSRLLLNRLELLIIIQSFQKIMSSERKEASNTQPSAQRPQETRGDSKCGGFQRRRINLKALMKKKGWSGKWSGKEEVKYVKFLQENLAAMEDEQARKKSRIFVKMSKFMRTRSSEQCRSHHQKLINYHKTVASIIDHFHDVIFPRMPPRLPKSPLTQPSNINIINQSSKGSSFYSMTIIDNRITIEIDSWKIQDFRF